MNFKEQLESAQFKLQQAFNAPDYSNNYTLTTKEAIALHCYIISMEGQIQRLTEENNRLNTEALHN